MENIMRPDIMSEIRGKRPEIDERIDDDEWGEPADECERVAADPWRNEQLEHEPDKRTERNTEKRLFDTTVTMGDRSRPWGRLRGMVRAENLRDAVEKFRGRFETPNNPYDLPAVSYSQTRFVPFLEQYESDGIRDFRDANQAILHYAAIESKYRPAETIDVFVEIIDTANVPGGQNATNNE